MQFGCPYFAENYNLIVLGKPSENSFAAQFLDTIPLELTEGKLGHAEGLCVHVYAYLFHESIL